MRILLENFTKRFGNVTVIENMNLEVRDGEMLARQNRYQISGNLGRVRKRLIINIWKVRYNVPCLCRCHIKLCVVGPKEFRHSSRVWRFVELLFLESDRESANGPW